MVHFHGRLLVATCHSNHSVVKYSHLQCHKKGEISRKYGRRDAHVDAIDHVDKLHESHLSDDSILALHWKRDRGWRGTTYKIRRESCVGCSNLPYWRRLEELRVEEPIIVEERTSTRGGVR